MTWNKKLYFFARIKNINEKIMNYTSKLVCFNKIYIITLLIKKLLPYN